MDDYITPSLGGRIRADRPPVRALSRAIRPHFAHLRSSSYPRNHTNRTYRTVHITMTLAKAIDAAAAASEAVLAESSQALAAEHGESLRAAARAAAVTANAVFVTPCCTRSGSTCWRRASAPYADVCGHNGARHWLACSGEEHRLH